MKKLAASFIALSLLAACATVPTPPATAPGPDFLARNAAAKRVVTTPSGTYSTDGMLSPHVRYPGIEKTLKSRTHDTWSFSPDGTDGGRWISYADGSFIYISYSSRG